MKVLAFNLIFILSFFSVFHSVYYYRMKERIYDELGRPILPHLDSALMKRLGSFNTETKKSSFLNFTEKKMDPSKIRIGIFGDSYTYGDEVGEERDFPSQLQKILGDKYEVLNFGMSWFSVHQTYILWQAMHEKFELDLVIFGPCSLFRSRSLTFNHTDDLHPHYLHSRFVLDAKNELLEFIPNGSTHEERFLSYYGVFPALKYWRYDERAPSILRSYGHYFNVSLRNPFYYKVDTYNENRTINQLLIKKMAEESKDFLFFSDRGYLVDMELEGFLDEFEQVNQFYYDDPLSNGFPFRATNGHSTVFGNAIIAKILANLILKTDEKVQTPKFKMDELLAEVENGHLDLDLKKTPLLSALRMNLNDHPIAHFEIFPSFWRTHKQGRDLSLDQFKVLLGFACDNLPLSRTFYLGLDQARLNDFLRVVKREKLPLLTFKEYKNLIYLPMSDCFFSDKHHTISFARGVYHNLLVEELKFLEIYEIEKAADEYFLYRATADWIKLRVDPDLDPNLLDLSEMADNRLNLSHQ